MQNFIEKQYKKKKSLFWKLQVSGWLTFGFTQAINSFANNDNINFLTTIITSVISGFLITILLRILYRFLRKSHIPASTMILSIISAIIVCAVILSYIDLWVVEQIFFIDVQIYEFLAGSALYDVFVLLIWTGAYFIINNQFLLMEQKEMYLKAVAQANQAQLQMLRYQINPHFLFNTLNAISTLVLDKQSKEANGMLTKLSAFLRFSLVNQPTQKITIKEEVYALWLYLDIEKVRFEERLKLDFNISDEANTAMVPSLLLQPLVENAVKYAIAPMEDGGTIMLDITVQNFSTRLDVVLRDTGPGLSDTPTEHKYNENSSGVGLDNTRNRLQELYPNDFTLKIENYPEGGVIININIPFEAEKGNSDAN